MLTHCFLRILAVLASFLVAITKHPDESSLGEKGSFVHYNSDYSSSLWVRNRGRGLRQLVTLHPPSRSREERINVCMLLLSSLSPYLSSSVSCSGNDATHSGWVFPLNKVKYPQLCPQVNLI